VPEGQIAGEEEARCKDRGPFRTRRSDTGRTFQPRPQPERRQRQGDAPEGAGERADFCEANEDRRDPHRDGAAEEREKGRRTPLGGVEYEAIGSHCGTGRVAALVGTSYHASRVFRERSSCPQ
jgi:hypothetical protein